MNKQKVDQWIPRAYEILDEVGIAQNGKVEKAFRNKISTFGAAVINGSVLAAISFFSDKGSAADDRTLLMKAIMRLIAPKVQGELYAYVRENGDKAKSVKKDILDATVALKLAMNLYELVEQKR